MLSTAPDYVGQVINDSRQFVFHDKETAAAVLVENASNNSVFGKWVNTLLPETKNEQFEEDVRAVGKFAA